MASKDIYLDMIRHDLLSVRNRVAKLEDQVDKLILHVDIISKILEDDHYETKKPNESCL